MTVNFTYPDDNPRFDAEIIQIRDMLDDGGWLTRYDKDLKRLYIRGPEGVHLSFSFYQDNWHLHRHFTGGHFSRMWSGKMPNDDVIPLIQMAVFP